jgi:hypothetical protein
MGKMKEMDIDRKMKDEDSVSLKEWIAHIKQWLLSCPIFDNDLHCYTGALSSNIKTCMVCGKKVFDEIDERELEFDKKFTEFMKGFNIGEE